MAKVGRPTKYKPEYCEQVVEHMKTGLSFETFAPTIGIASSQLYEWLKKYPEFQEAQKIAFDHSRLFWEREGIKGLWSDKQRMFNSAVFCFNMKNRFGWRDNVEQNVNINIDGIVFDSSDDE